MLRNLAVDTLASLLKTIALAENNAERTLGWAMGFSS